MNKALLKELLELSPADRIDIATELWDSIASEDMPPLTAEQLAELDRRLADHERNPDRSSSWEEVRARLWARQK